MISDDVRECQDLIVGVEEGYLSLSAHKKHCPIHGDRQPNERLVDDGEALGRDDSYGIQSGNQPSLF